MKLSLSEPRYLKDSISIIADLVTEARFKFSEDLVELIAMDPANVAMVIFKMFSSSFASYELTQDEEIGINLGNLKQIMRRVGPSDILHLEIVDNKLNIQIDGKATRTFSIPILEMDERQQKVPDLKFPIKVTTATSVLNDAIEDVDIVGESVAFLCDAEVLTIAAEGDLSRVKIDIKKDDVTLINAENPDPVKAKYSIEYLKKMAAGSKLTDTVNILFSSDYPLKLEFVAVDKVYLGFILAPRVENY